jgi:hypothetical protein
MRNEVEDMMTIGGVARVFRPGDEVVLAEGTYQGTPGVFLGLRPDVNWADITERNGSIRSHPVAWLAHSTGAGAGSGNRR